MENTQPNAGANFVFIETHLQVSNLVKILLTIPFDVLQVSVENIPAELRDSQHAKVLTAVLNFYKDVISSAPTPSQEAASPQDEAPAQTQLEVAADSASPKKRKSKIIVPE